MPSLPERREAAPENPLRRRISLLCRNSVKTDQDAAAAWKKGDKVPQPRRLDGEEQWVSERLKIHGDDAAEQPRRGGTRSSSEAKKSTAAEDFASLFRGSCPRCHRLEGGGQDAAATPPGRRGTRGTRATKSTAAEELAPVLLGEVAEKL